MKSIVAQVGLLGLFIAVAAQSATISTQNALCTQYAYASQDGYDILNNLWGMDTATSGSQCTYYYGVASGGGVVENNVKSYAYAGRQFTRPLISNVKSLPTTAIWSYFGTDIRANVAYDLFTHPDANHVNYNGEYELMIWLNRYGGVWPITESGSALETITLAGHSFDLYFGYNGDMKVYSFVVSDAAIGNFSGDILDFFNYLADNYSFPISQQYLLIDQFGSEGFTGTNATFTVSRFQAEVNI
ncbi:concanavalin A-like lectin/glucanase domain-containing protein [Truncatella angustata]|uniref:Concanavalin A-like lectin/glucanase domain-containing protein n=1 Tax=Truncatella angustata TaxID=152316 RepID=A0A9P8UBW9_9PEZI|nr:concanavalin A-like lectin/glucanase domain-containing protein [Truncatella angustata]KAH6645440.1 concanavalin A-like lectin/glucanase domain-containing protein [Truncatella angustata]